MNGQIAEYVWKDRMQNLVAIRVFTLDSPLPHFLTKFLQGNGQMVTVPLEAHFLLLPFMYEFIYDYKPAKLRALGIDEAALQYMKQQAEELDELSVRLQKKLIVLFYRDPVQPLPFRNSLVFRTSGFLHRLGANTFGLPAFVDGRPANGQFFIREKGQKPVVSFRGKAAPLRLPYSLAARCLANQLLERVGSQKRVKNYQPAGYLLRRKAVLSCLAAGPLLETDMVVNPVANIPGYKGQYLESFALSDYFICAAGFGNYAYRLYETMREGRIPVYIDTGWLLPCSDKINWKERMVWVPERDVAHTAQYILEFHHQIHPDDFKALQEANRSTYFKYLTTQGFSRYLATDFLPGWLEMG